MKPLIVRFTLIIYFFFNSILVYSQNDFENIIDSILISKTDNSSPGLAIAVLNSDSVLMSKGYGLANLEHKIPFTSSTVSDIGSVSKHFTTYCILLCQEKGWLNIDDKIHKYLPELPDFGHDITIVQLMHHTSGLREIYNSMYVHGIRSGDGIYQEDVYRLFRDMNDLNFAPGEKYSYCNSAYMLLAEIVSKVSGHSFEEFISSNVFQPLGMNNSFVMDKPGEIFPNMAESYSSSGDDFLRIFDHSSIQGAGGIYTTLDDLIIWVQHLFSEKGKKYLDQMAKPGVINSGEALKYGLGLSVTKNGEHIIIGHSGASAGYRAYFMFCPSLNIGYVVKTNTPNINLTTIRTKLFKSFGIPIPESPSNTNKPKDLQPVSPDQAKDLIGTYYADEIFAISKIRIDQDQVVLNQFRKDDVPLFQKNETSLTDQFNSFTINLQRNEEGTISGFTLDSGRSTGQKFKKIE